MTPFSGSCHAAASAVSLASMNIRIKNIKWVPTVAVSLSCISGYNRVPAQHIVTVGNGLNMQWVHAGAVPAEMIGLQAVRDWAD